MTDVTESENLCSATIGKLAAALAKAQADIRPAAKDSKNPFFGSSYADLASVWEVIREPLTSNGLSVIQTPLATDGKSIQLRTVLAHESGEWIASTLVMCPGRWETTKDINGNKTMHLIDDPTPQGMGSCLTYARRYALAAIVGVCSEEDDDGNAASGRTRREEPAEPSKAAPKPVGAVANKPKGNAANEAPKAKADLLALMKLIEDHDIPQETQGLWLNHFHVKSLDQLAQKDVDAIVAQIKKKLNLT